MEGGDAYYTFAEGTDRIESSTTLVDATALYLSNGLNGVVPQKYGKTDGRVTVIRSCDAVLTAESQISGPQDIPSTAFQIENVCEDLQEYVLIASYYSDAQQQIAVEVKETGPLSQGNVQTLQLNGCEGAACAKLYVVHEDDLTPACATVQYGGKTVSPVSAIEPLAQTHTARSIPSADGVEAYSDHWWSTDADITADLSDFLGLTYSLTVSDRTSFAFAPKTYDKDALIEWGKDPGLGVDILRKHGYTGSGAVIAYIDQPLQLPLHEEYENLKLHYINTVDGGGAENSMHGPAVLSLLAGKTIGTAPDAEIYYYAHASWKAD